MKFIGIDKTTIRAFIIETMDIGKLLLNNNVILQLKQKDCEPYRSFEDICGEWQEVSYLKITDGHMFNSLVVGVKINNDVWNPYCSLEMSIVDGTDNNLKPLSVSEYHNKIKRLKSYLQETYGLDINFKEAKFDKLELNITAQMDYDFIYYQYLLEMMVYLTPRHYKVECYHDKKSRYITEYKFYNKSTSGKIYDKTFQILDGFKIKLDKQYMRMEYTLNKTKDIVKALDSANIYEISDSIINEWLTNKITKDLVNPTQKYITTSEKKLFKLAQEEKATNSKCWIKNFIIKAMSLRMNKTTGELPIVLDLKQLEQIVIKLTDSRHRSRTLRRLQGVFMDYEYAKDNIKKLEEIIIKFSTI